ncbi:MAG: NAD-dependent malic enzyme [Polyangia bacterium]|jgi:malate dehydrogenase (oxaloacetate-decarboxylating)|nr:NAD-dependent malic enzyme [Polyangia bacterium]
MRFSIRIDSTNGQRYLAVNKKGAMVINHAFTNKGTAYTQEEREALELHGLLPPRVFTMAEQLQRVYGALQSKTSPLERYIYLMSLLDRNETLFYRIVHEHIDELMPIVYTPTVGEACQKYSHIFRRSRGLFVSYEDRDRIPSILKNATTRTPSIIVVTDGERILGLGDQGAGGMGISIGKLCLYTLCAGIQPFSTIPIALDVGTDNEGLLEDPLYIGLRQKRVRGAEYQEFIDRFVQAVKEVFPNVLLQWEDFLKGNAIHQLRRFRNELCTFNDDIQGTAGVVVAGLYGALRLTGGRMRDQKVVFAGAGASAQGISDLLVAAMQEDGLSREEAVARIYTTDSRGLVTKHRASLEDFKATYARPVEEVAGFKCADRGRITLKETIENVRPTVLLGSSGTPGTFDEGVVRMMAQFQERPIIFPLSNPTSKVECTPEDALRWSEGRAVVATGSPFPKVALGGKTFRIGQCNNAFVFPGVGLGIIVGRVRRVTDGMFLASAQALAELVTPADLAENAVFPELSRIRECSRVVAEATIRRAVAEGHADPQCLLDIEETVPRAMWFPSYLPMRYEF